MTNSTEIKLNSNLKKYRTMAGFSQEKLSELVGVSPDYISLIERGKRMPSIKKLFMLADVLKIEAYLLLK